MVGQVVDFPTNTNDNNLEDDSSVDFEALEYVVQLESTCKSKDSENDNETSDKDNVTKRRRSFSQRVKRRFSGSAAAQKGRTVRRNSKKWMNDTLAHLKKEDTQSEELVARTSRTKKKGWKRYRKSRQFTFSSPEEYMEYAQKTRKSSGSSLELTLEKAKQRGTVSTEFEVLDAAMALDDTLLVPFGNDSNRDESDGAKDSKDEGDENNDGESKNSSTAKKRVSTDNTIGTQEQKPRCFKRKITRSDVIRVLVLWGVIMGMSILLGIHPAISERTTESPSNTPTPAPSRAPLDVLSADSIVAETTAESCSLCPVGSGVMDKDLTVVMAGIACQSDESDESLCSFRCENSLPTPRVYTCGEVEELARESSSRCINDDFDSCTNFQQASAQCCSPNWEKMTKLSSLMSQHAVDEIVDNGD